MNVLHDETLRVNSGGSWKVMKGQRIRITFQSVVDFVVFNLDNLSERFDQARTKANQGKIYVTTGDMLMSKLNNSLMTIVEDTFKGTHDLQYGMCSACSYTMRWNKRDKSPWKELFAEAGVTEREDLPLWGCFENIMTALQNYPIIPLDIPAPFNIGQHMTIDPATGKMTSAYRRDNHHSMFNPAPHIDLRADMNCLCAASCDPGAGKLGAFRGFYAKPVHVQIFDH
jgi:uncharacterized protein